MLIPWHDEVTNARQVHDLGGYETYEWPNRYTMPLRAKMQPRLAEAVADAALRMIEASEQGQPIEPIRREIHRPAFRRRAKFRRWSLWSYNSILTRSNRTDRIAHGLSEHPIDQVVFRLGRSSQGSGEKQCRPS